MIWIAKIKGFTMEDSTMTQPEVGEKEFRAKDVGLRQKDKGFEDL